MISRIKYVWVYCILIGMMGTSFAETADTLHYTDAKQLTLIGKPLPGGPFYHRLDTAAFPAIPLTVKRLLTHSAGLAVSFSTNSTKIAAKWCTSSRKPGNNMTAIAFEGMDLYIKRDGQWQYAGVARPDTNQCNAYTLVQNMEPGDKECLLYLPLYDETTSLQIGVEADAEIAARPNPFKKNIVIYGSSIVHGASASRPGLAYPARLSRQTGYHFLNFGVSGNAKMELEVAKVLAQMDMDAFILDCVPNSSPAQVTARTADLVKTIRADHPGVPIIAIQSIVREGGNFNQSIAKRVADQNANFKHEIDQLQKEVDDLYLITADGLLGDDHEATTDGTHPNDLGFDRMLQKIRPAVLKILKQYGI
ncbi:SGNH/GDSL hydrolase family protein [Parapedobacter sp. 10938]|uniref:SGNH/GDSL hydrolase family protein n=1 Tax=Parapedobacter flavus TaxID=3110225 RepID=UPI002DB990A8|nr:SGNH/GDSL hydrolase family protein [Parapedobacter sp. 10938]MEC3880436.1 SGNH/GDSL hydrolase family protein [Parapedobacter sp. 10938]